MRDQAEELRLKMLKGQGRLAKSIAIVSGKGGVGKSNFSTNFAYSLQLRGKKVIVVDMDLGMGNIHILLGVTPRYSLKDYLLGEQSLDAVLNRDTHGLTFISGGSGLDTILDWTEPMFERLLLAFERLQQDYDVILFDMGAGATQRSIDLIVAVDEVIVISTTEPTSITDAYSMMKFICLQDADKKFSIVTNRVSKGQDGNESATRLQYAMKKFLAKETTLLGFLPEDAVVHKSVIAQKPFILEYPNALISKRLLAIADMYVTDNQLEPIEKTKFIQKLKGIFLKGRD